MLAGKFINCLMSDGKKTIAQKVFYDALAEIARRGDTQEHAPIEVFEAAIENIKPYIEVRSKRVGGASYQVPMQVNRARQQSLGDSLAAGGGARQEGPPDALEIGR